MNNTFMINKKTVIVFSALLLCFCMTVTLFGGMNANAEEFNETNPELTAVTINSDVESEVSGLTPYNAQTNFSQNGSSYSLSSNSYVAWLGNDDISYAYKSYNVQNAESDYLQAEVTVNSAATSSSNSIDANASIGLMIRSSLESDAGEVFIHLRGTEILAVFRSKQGGRTNVQYTNVQTSFPCTLKAVVKGNQVILYYKSGNSDYVKFKYPIGFNYTGPIYVGLAAHSCNQKVFINGSFSNLLVSGVGTYDGSGNASASDNSGTTSSEYVAEAPPLTDDVLYRQTFSTGDFTEISKTTEGKIENQDGNRVWFKNFIDSEDYMGSTDWTDYEVSARINFSQNCNPDLTNSLKLAARHTAIEFYGVCEYDVEITGGYKINIIKRVFTNAGVEIEGTVLQTYNLREILGDANYTCLGDGEWHEIKMRAFDNCITAYWDGKLIGSYLDDGTTKGEIGERVFGYGCIGISTFETSVYIDDIVVKKLEDAFGGDYDNKIGGNWDSPIPDYISDWESTY